MPRMQSIALGLGILVTCGSIWWLNRADTRRETDDPQARHVTSLAAEPATKTWLAAYPDPRSVHGLAVVPLVMRGGQVWSRTEATAWDYMGGAVARPGVTTPSTGEGAPEDDWDKISTEQRVQRALERFEEARDKADAAVTESDRSQWRETALHELSAIRAELFELDGDLERYATLQKQIGE